MGEMFIAVDCPIDALAEIIKGLEPGEEIRYAGDGSVLKAMGKATAPNIPPDKGCWSVRILRSSTETKFTSMVFQAIETFALEDEPASVFVGHKRVDFYYHLRESE